uniref:Neurexin n=1 Tax=Knipowitschia caucasica TaxID=637954 RepID=A0AAV2JIP8_KNICA
MGICIQQWENYTCDCSMTSYTGTQCNDPGTTYIFGKGGGLITYNWPANERPSTRTDRLTVGFSTSLKEGILVRIDSAAGLGDYLMLHIQQGKIGVTFNVGTVDITVQESTIAVNDGKYHVVRFTRNGGNATLQVDNWAINEHFPTATSDSERYQMANKKIPFKYTRPVEEWLQEKGRQLTIFNTQATVSIGGSDRGRPFQGQLSGLYYNSLKVLGMAAEGNPHIRINGSVRLVGDVSSAGSGRSTATPPDGSSSFMETTTMMSTTTARKHRSSSTTQHTTDDMVSSAECSSDDEDLDECESSVAGGELANTIFQDPLAPLVLAPCTLHPSLSPPLTPPINETTKEPRPVRCGPRACRTEAAMIVMMMAPMVLAKRSSQTCSLLTIRRFVHLTRPEPHHHHLCLRRNLLTTEMNSLQFSLTYFASIAHTLCGTEHNARGALIISPMSHDIPTALPTEPGVRQLPGPSEVVRESSSTTGMVIGIVAAAALCILILLYAMYKYRNRDEGSYQVDESRHYITNSAVQSNGNIMKDKQQSLKGSHKKQKNKDKEYYV